MVLRMQASSLNIINRNMSEFRQFRHNLNSFRVFFLFFPSQFTFQVKSRFFSISLVYL